MSRTRTRTRTAEQSSLTFTLPEGTGTLEFASKTSPEGDDITVTRIPPGSSWGPLIHWHQTHAEGFRVLKGFAHITIGHTTRICGPDDGDMLVQPNKPHVVKRADCADAPPDPAQLAACDARDKGWRERDVVMEEWTVPSDGSKEVFFRNTASFYKDEIEPFVTGGMGVRDVPRLVARIMQALAAQPKLDTYVLLVGKWGMDSEGNVNWFAKLTTGMVLAFAGGFNWLFGGRLWHREYIPRHLWPVCVETMGE